MRRLALLSVLLFACAPVPQERLSDRVSENEVKLARLEQKHSSLEKDLEKTNERIDRLTKLVSELRIDIENLKLKLGEGVTEPTAEKKEEQTPKVSQKVDMTKVPNDDEENAYRKAVDLYNLKRLYEARDAFLEFVKRFPESKYTDNAFFWIGRIYQELGDSQKAEKVYLSLVEKCEGNKLPDCNKLPDAYLQLIRIYLEKGDKAKAKEYYSSLVKRFPNSEAAARAKDLMGE